MSNVFDVLFNPESDILIELAEDLDGILSNIAYAEGGEDFEYIQNSGEYLRRKYEEFVRTLRVHIDDASGLGKAVESVKTAYDNFQSIFEVGGYTPEDFSGIVEEAENILGEFLHWVYPDEVYVKET